jgi:hypothetical protein
MDYPPAWEFISLEEFDTFSFRPAHAAGLEVVVHFEGGRAGDFRITTGGNKMIPVKFAAEKLLGPRFSGNKDQFSSFWVHYCSIHALPIHGECPGSGSRFYGSGSEIGSFSSPRIRTQAPDPVFTHIAQLH